MTMSVPINAPFVAWNYAPLRTYLVTCGFIVGRNHTLAPNVDRSLRKGIIFIDKCFFVESLLTLTSYICRYNMMAHFKTHQGIHRVVNKAPKVPI